MIEHVVLRRDAAEEFAEAHRWYENQRIGLGESFKRSISEAVERVREHPERYPYVHGAVRRVLVQRFPYGIFYKVEPNRIVVISVFHGSRDPRRWRERE